MKQKKDSTFGERLKQIRQALKFVQKDFAKSLKISKTALSDIENGKHKPIHVLFCNIVKNHDVNLYWLLFGEGKMFSETDSENGLKLIEKNRGDHDLKEFMYYFEHSPFVKHYLMTEFRRLLLNDKESIKKDVENFAEENLNRP